MATRSEMIARARAEATQGVLDGRELPAGGAWITTARQEALARLRQLGLPDRRDEYWKFTSPVSLVAQPAEPADLFDIGEPAVFDGIERLRLVFVDGVFDPQASDDLALAGIEIEPLAQAAARDLHWARDLYGKLEAAGQQPVPRSLAAMNTAFAEQGMVIRVTGTPDRPVSMVYRRTDAAADAMVHHVIRVEPGAELTVLENGPAAARLNSVMEVDVAAGGRLHHVRAQGRDHQRRAITHSFARLAEGASFKSFTLTVNGRLTRNECVIWLEGREAVAHVAGACVGDGDFHQDDTIFVTHAAERCESRQVFKKVLRNGALGVFQGKILVHPAAQLTDGYQISQSLLLDERSQFLAKPELEIYADDVKCSHGSTSGALDPDMMFYLRARGVPRGEAETLLTLAFLAEAIDEVEDERLAEDLRNRLHGWLIRHKR